MSDDTPDRNNHLQQLMDSVVLLIEAQIATQWTEKSKPDFLLIMVDDDLVETCTCAADHESLFEAMSDVGAEWMAQGLIEPLDPLDDADAEPTPPIRTN